MYGHNLNLAVGQAKLQILLRMQKKLAAFNLAALASTAKLPNLISPQYSRLYGINIAETLIMMM